MFNFELTSTKFNSLIDANWEFDITLILLGNGIDLFNDLPDTILISVMVDGWNGWNILAFVKAITSERSEQNSY